LLLLYFTHLSSFLFLFHCQANRLPRDSEDRAFACIVAFNQAKDIEKFFEELVASKIRDTGDEGGFASKNQRNALKMLEMTYIAVLLCEGKAEGVRTQIVFLIESVLFIIFFPF
jgi:hypothetical protein